MSELEMRNAFRAYQVNVFTRIGALFMSGVCLLLVDIFLIGLDVKKVVAEVVFLGIGVMMGVLKSRLIEKASREESTFVTTYMKAHSVIESGLRGALSFLIRYIWILVFSPLSILLGIIALLLVHISLPIVMVEIGHLGYLYFFIRKQRQHIPAPSLTQPSYGS